MTTLMSTTLNNYTIDDFLKFKKPIYNYCIKLTLKRDDDFLIPDSFDAEDLFHETYLYVHDKYFNTPKEKIEEKHFINRMKMCVKYAYMTRIKKKNGRVHFLAARYQEDEESEYVFNNSYSQDPEIFKDLSDNPDYNMLMKTLKFSERLVVSYILKGYNKAEIGRIFKKHPNYVDRVLTKIKDSSFKIEIIRKPVNKRLIVKKEGVIDDLTFVKSKVQNFEVIFKTDKLVSLYSLYLQGFDHKIIAEKFNKSVSQVNVEIYRINQKIKKYNGSK